MIRASQILFWLGLSISVVTALYYTSDRTRELNHQLREINAAIDAEQQNIHVLKAEWVFLSNPTRVEEEAKKLIALKPTAPAQVIQLADLDDALPTREEAEENVAVTSTPIANVETNMAALPPPPAPKPAYKIAVAATDTGHINTRIKIQRTASAQPADSIGVLINGLGTHP